MRSQLSPSPFSLVWFSGVRSGYILMNRLALLVQVLVYLNYLVFATQPYNLLREIVFLISRFQRYQQFELRHSNRFKLLMITEALRKIKFWKFQIYYYLSFVIHVNIIKKHLIVRRIFKRTTYLKPSVLKN